MTINSFSGEFEFLSNFYMLSHEEERFLWGYPSVEHFYQAMKTTDPIKRAIFKGHQMMTAGQAKRAGRRITLRPDWEDIKDDVMMKGLMAKFAIPHLRQSLESTWQHDLIEGNYWHDNYWGDCSCAKCHNIHGQNKLGQALMVVREISIPEPVEGE